MKKIYTLSKYHHKSSTTGVNKRGKWMMVGIENKNKWKNEISKCWQLEESYINIGNED